MVYNNGGNRNGGNRVDSGKRYKERAELALVLLNLISVGASNILLVYLTLSTDYLSTVLLTAILINNS